MTLIDRVSALITVVGADVKALFVRSVPSGGTTGQVLSKSSDTSYDTTWTTSVTQEKIDAVEALNWFL